MAAGNEMEATKRQIEELTAALGQKLSSLSAEEIGRLYNKKDQFVEQCGAIAAKLAEPEPIAPIAPPAHETIRIPCTIGGRKYMACGFLRAKESSVNGQVMLDRTQVEGTTAIDDGEWTHLMENRKDFQKYPDLDPYYLATERRDPRFPEYLSYLGRSGAGRCERSLSVEGLWNGRDLVLRRCT